jgi:hypothetical protein
MAAFSPGGPFQPHTITRRGCHINDVVINIKYAGICHSDIHQVRLLKQKRQNINIFTSGKRRVGNNNFSYVSETISAIIDLLMYLKFKQSSRFEIINTLKP